LRPLRSNVNSSRTHRGEASDLTQEALEVLVRAVTGDAFIPENLILPQGIVPLCEGVSAGYPANS